MFENRFGNYVLHIIENRGSLSFYWVNFQCTILRNFVSQVENKMVIFQINPIPRWLVLNLCRLEPPKWVHLHIVKSKIKYHRMQHFIRVCNVCWNKIDLQRKKYNIEHSGSVVECLIWDRGVAGLSLTSATALCPWTRHINPCLVLVQPRKTHPDITEKLLTGT